MDTLAAAFSRPIAHRGLHDRDAGIIENSQSAFAAAINAGYGIECDIQLSGDDVPVVFHDYSLNRLTAQKGMIEHISADQLRRIPLENSSDRPQSFKDFLDQVSGTVPLVVELKSQNKRNINLARGVLDAAKDYTGPLVFKSFDPRLLKALRSQNCSWPIGIVLEKEKPKEANWAQGFMLRHLLHYPSTRFDFLSCNVDDLTLPMVRLFRALGFKAMTWTVTSDADLLAAKAHADQIVFEGSVKEIL